MAPIFTGSRFGFGRSAAGAAAVPPNASSIYSLATHGFRFNGTGTNSISPFGNGGTNWNHTSLGYNLSNTGGVANTGKADTISLSTGILNFTNGVSMPTSSLSYTSWNQTNFSFSCWYKGTQTNDSNNQSGNNRATLGVVMFGNDQNNANGCWGLQGGKPGWGTADNYHLANTTINNGNWRHMAITNKNNGDGTSTSKIYIDGALNSTNTYTQGSGPVAQGVYRLGSHYVYANNTAPSEIDLWTVWYNQTVLTDSEISLIYTAQETFTPTNPL